MDDYDFMTADFSPLSDSAAIDNLECFLEIMYVLEPVLETGSNETCYFIDKSSEQRSVFSVSNKETFPTLLREAFNFDLLTFLQTEPGLMERYCEAFLETCFEHHSEIDNCQVMALQSKLYFLLDLLS